MPFSSDGETEMPGISICRGNGLGEATGVVVREISRLLKEPGK